MGPQVLEEKADVEGEASSGKFVISKSLTTMVS
jgi:hypothetical protein